MGESLGLEVIACLVLIGSSLGWTWLDVGFDLVAISVTCCDIVLSTLDMSFFVLHEF